MNKELLQRFGNIDIYLFDQLLKGTYDGCHTILDAGCGGGRNIVHFLQKECAVYGIDSDPGAIDALRAMVAEDAKERFVVASIEYMPFPDATFDLVICSAVLHFARNDAHFNAMLHAIWRVLRPGGYLFARLASDIGIEPLVTPIGNGRYLLPDGSERYLVNEAMLNKYAQELHAQPHEPLKTTNVANLRSMTTWCLRKN